MRQIQSTKYNIAWFKLAEYVSKGEKERALTIYRLLILSMNDPAFAMQLEGDLLLAFKDESGIDKYLKAISLYKKNNFILEAEAVQEHLLKHLKNIVDDYALSNDHNLLQKFLIKLETTDEFYYNQAMDYLTKA